MKYLIRSLCAAAALAMALPASAYVKPVIAETSTLPAIFETAPAQERIKAIRVAELDATRKLMERIYGVAITSDTVIYDLVLADDQVGASLKGLVRGAKTVEGPLYLEDGQVLVVKALTLRTVIEDIRKIVKTQGNKVISEESLVLAERRYADLTIDETGNGALPGSLGLARIQARRAAELDAYRRLAERVLGVSIASDTTVKDMALRSDKITARLVQVLEGAKTTGVVYQPDGSCEVTMQISLVDVYHIIEHYNQGGKHHISSSIEADKRILTEVGYGVARPDEPEEAPQGIGAAEDYRETTLIVRRLLGTGVVID